MATPSYIGGASGLQRGIGADETGIKGSSFTTTIENPREYCYSKEGTRNGWAEDFDPSISVAIEGELSGTTEVAAAKFGTALTLANSNSAKLADVDGTDTYAGITDAGGWYLDESLTITESRDGFKTFSATFLKLPEVS